MHFEKFTESLQSQYTAMILNYNPNGDIWVHSMGGDNRVTYASSFHCQDSTIFIPGHGMDCYSKH